MVNKMRNISKQAWQAAKDAGETTLTFAAWRAEQKQEATAAGETVTTITTADTTGAGVVEGELVNDKVADTSGDSIDASGVSTEQVMATVDAAIDTVQTAQAAAVVVTGSSKSKLAQAIFAEELEKQKTTGVAMVRKDVIKRFIDEAGLTKSGANTYYQNIRERNGLVTKKA